MRRLPLFDMKTRIVRSFASTPVSISGIETVSVTNEVVALQPIGVPTAP